MLKNILFSFAIIICMSFTAHAQTDSTDYDLGQISVKKDFTQNVTIKGSDLERYQFSDLADAINVWLSGTYSNPSTLIYVIDGNIITDVNAYSIYDIDQITLVQNALAQVSGANPGQQMVLIKLKTNRPGKQGVEAAGQTSLVNMANLANTPGEKTTTNIYDQYYLGAYKNFSNFNFGLSADYQHDVLPVLGTQSYNSLDPLNYNRFKFTGYAGAKLWRGTTVKLGINYVPQTSGSGFNYNVPGFVDPVNQVYRYGATQHLVNTNLAINSHIVKGLVNNLSFAYNHYNYFEKDSLADSSPGISGYNSTSIGGAFAKVSNLLLRDNLVYQKQVGVFYFEPSINFSYRKISLLSSETSASFEGPVNGSAENFSEQSEGGGSKLYLLAPALNIYYKDIFNVQAGFVDIANSGSTATYSGYMLQRLSPFVTTSADIFKLWGINNMSLKIFGSFSRQNQLLNDSYATLAGFGAVVELFGTNSPTITGISGTPTTPVAYTSNNPYHQYNNYQAGLVFAPLKNFSVNYNYIDNYGLDYVLIYVPYGENETETELAQYYDQVITNRVGVNYSFSSTNFTWRAGLNVAQSKLEVVDDARMASYYSAYLDGGHRYSGGFTNRFTYKTWFAGLDVLYQVGQRPLTLENATYGVPAPATNVNSYSLQNLYIGSQIKINAVKYAELFVNTRNILQNKTSDITDNRRFYGFGVKVGW